MKQVSLSTLGLYCFSFVQIHVPWLVLNEFRNPRLWKLPQLTIAFSKTIKKQKLCVLLLMNLILCKLAELQKSLSLGNVLWISPNELSL